MSVSLCASGERRLKRICADRVQTEKQTEGHSWTLNFLLIGVRLRAINFPFVRNEINR